MNYFVAGYRVCANNYTTEVCFDNVCKYMLVKSIVYIYDNYYLPNHFVGAGFIGLGMFFMNDPFN